VGQRLAERIYTLILLLFTTVGFVFGFVKEDFGVTTTFWKIGTGLVLLLTVPSWPWFNRNPLPWQKPGPMPVRRGKAVSLEMTAIKPPALESKAE